jgi:alpha-1,3-rhamnosyl/mannosyltransferase
LWRHLDAVRDAEVYPVAGYGGSFETIAATYRRGLAFPLNFGASSAISILSGASFPGAKDLSKRIDVYHATDYWIPKLGRIPVVATLHDAIPLSHPHWATPQHRTLKNALLRIAARWADTVITVSNAMVPIIAEQFRIRAERITVIPNGVDDAWFERLPDDVRHAALARHGLRPGYFLTVGTLQPRKNHARLLAAHRALPADVRREHPLVIVGRRGWADGDVLAGISEGRSAGEVFWLDYVDDADLRAIFQGAHALVFPSLFEGFGLPVVEAFASAVPVITSNVSALPEISGDAALQVDPLDVEAIRNAMHGLATDQHLHRRLASSGAARARMYSWQTCAERVMEVYRRMRRG